MISNDFKSTSKADAMLNFILGTPEAELRKAKQKEVESLRRIKAEMAQLREREQGLPPADTHRGSLMEQQRKLRHSLQHLHLTALHFPGLERGRAGLEVPHVAALVKGNLTFEECIPLGIQPRSKAGSIFTADIALDKLAEVVAHPAIEFVEYSGVWAHDLQEAVIFAGIDTLHNAPNNLKGAGVVIGIIDDYLDIYHPDFRLDDGAGGDGLGSSRVRYYWDQALTPIVGESSPPADPVLPGFFYQGGTAYGVEYDQATLNAELNAYNPAAPNAYGIFRSAPEEGSHGTCVASCAAGNGRGTGQVGAAPEADIIFVNMSAPSDTATDYINIDKAAYLDAFAYIFARASQLGQACVVNLSSSDNMGPHDGKTLGEEFLNELLETTGRAITCSAGNTSGQGENHQGTVLSGIDYSFTLSYTLSATKNDMVEIWYDGHDQFDLELSFIDPTGAAIVLGVPAGGTASYARPDGFVVDVISTLGDARNGDNVISVITTGVDADTAIPVGDWVFTLSSAQVVHGKFHAWVERNNRGYRAFAVPAFTHQVATPATGVRTLAVGNHMETNLGLTPSISSSSSRGPTRDGRRKPEISATGSNMLMANAREMNLAPTAALTITSSGTSFSAPLVAGVCALIFESLGASLSWFDVKQILTETATSSDSNTLGFGWLQAANIPITTAADADAWLKDDAADAGVEPFTGPVWWDSPDIVLRDANLGVITTATFNSLDLNANVVDVTLRSRGTHAVRNLKVSLYWRGQAALGGKSPWHDTGFSINQDTPISIFTDSFTEESNSATIKEILPGTTALIRFAWSPQSTPGYTPVSVELKAVLRAEADRPMAPSISGPVKLDNNKAKKVFSTLVLAAGGGQNKMAKGRRAQALVPLEGAGDPFQLAILTEGLEGDVTLSLPASCIKVNHAEWHLKHGPRKPGLGKLAANVLDWISDLDHAWTGKEIERRTGIQGARKVRLRKGVLQVEADLRHLSVLKLPALYAPLGEQIQMSVQVNEKHLSEGRCGLHLLHRHPDGEEDGMFLPWAR
jgi:hypothetical protein